jgi:hypothetical protein
MILKMAIAELRPHLCRRKVVDPAINGAFPDFRRELSFHLRILQAAKPMAVRNKWNRFIDRPRKEN